MSVLVVVREPEHKHAMEVLGLKISQSRGSKLYVLSLSEGESMPDIEWEESVFMHAAEVSCSNAKNMIMRVVKDLDPSLVILNDAQNHSKYYQETVSGVMEKASCMVLVMRLCEGEPRSEKVLVPCTGGRNSRLALKLAADSMKNDTTAFFVEPDVSEVSESVGYAHLERYVKDADLDKDDVHRQVVLDSDIYKGIKIELENGEYGTVLMGASQYSNVRSRLYGSIPDKIREQGVNIGVLRAGRPLGHRMKDSFERLLQLKVPQLNRQERISLFDEIEEKSQWSFDFAAFMALSTAIASLGLLADSVAVVIGAMLVAPLMMPLLGGGLALIQINWPLWKCSMHALLLGFMSAFSVGALIGGLARWLEMPLTAQLIARNEPNLLDLGVAFISGMAASYCLARPKLGGGLAGVAIAAALVPPIATSGICLAIGAYEVFRGAGLLFGLNVIAIIVGAAVNFYFLGVRRKASGGVWSQRLSLLLSIILIGVTVPLSLGLFDKFSKTEEIEKELAESLATYDVYVTDVKKGKEINGILTVTIEVESEIPISDEVLDIIEAKVEAILSTAVKVRVRTTLVRER